MESIPEAWERLQEYILAYPHHGMDEWLMLQSFYNGLTTTSRAHLDAAAGGAYLDLTIAKATALIEKMVSSPECLFPSMLQTRTLCARFVVTVDTQGMTTLRPEKTQPTSTTTTPGSVPKEARGGVKHAHHSKEKVTTLTQISIRTKPP